MRNRYLKDKTAADIDKLVHKIIRDVDCKEPPIRMEVVIDRLRLDKRYYSKTDNGFFTHGLRIKSYVDCSHGT